MSITDVGAAEIRGHVVLTDKPGIGAEVKAEVDRTFIRPGTSYFRERPYVP